MFICKLRECLVASFRKEATSKPNELPLNLHRHLVLYVATFKKGGSSKPNELPLNLHRHLVLYVATFKKGGSSKPNELPLNPPYILFFSKCPD